MIVGIFNGYYRSGTTIWMRIMDESNPRIPVLSEPTSPAVVRQIDINGFNRIEPLHGWNIFRGYGKLDKKVFFEYCKRWEEIFKPGGETKAIMTSWDEVKYLLEPFIECDQKIIIKANQLHFFLHRIVRELGIPCIHIKRAIHENIAGYLTPDALRDYNKMYEIMFSKERDYMFWVDSVYRNITKLLNFDPGLDIVIKKLIFNIYTCNKFVQSKGAATVVTFEEPSTVIRAIKENFKINIEPSKLCMLNPSKMFISPVNLTNLVTKHICNLKPLLEKAENSFKSIP